MGRHCKSPRLSFWPSSTPSPGAWSRQQNENSVQYVFYLLFVSTHAKFGLKKWNWHGNQNLIIFDLLTSLKGHQFDPSMKISLSFWSARYPRQLIWYATWPCLKIDPLGTPAPQSPIPGAWPRWQNENPVWYVLYLSFFLCTTHTKFGIKRSLKLTC